MVFRECVVIKKCSATLENVFTQEKRSFFFKVGDIFKARIDKKDIHSDLLVLEDGWGGVIPINSFQVI